MLCWKNIDPIDAIHVDAINIILKDFPKLKNFIFHPRKQKLNSTPQEIIKNCNGLSHGEKILVRMALDLWDGIGKVQFLEVHDTLGCHMAFKFLKAIQRLRNT